MAGENEGDTPGDKEGSEGKEGKGGEKEVLSQLASALETLATDMSEMKKTVGELKEKPAPSDDDDDEEGGEEEVLTEGADLESMSRQDFLKVVVKSVSKELGKELKKVQTSANSTREELERDRIKDQVSKVAAANPDFWEWADEIRTIANETPGISVKRAYALAKEEHPEKAKKLAEKFKDKGDKNGSGESDGKGKPRRMGGLLPTSGSEAPTQKMDRRTAAQKAWDAVVPPGGLSGDG